MDAEAGRQGAHGMRAVLCLTMGIGPERRRVIVPDTGRGFGARGGCDVESCCCWSRAAAAPATQWKASPSESFLSDYQARDHVLRGELALDADGRFTALRVAADWRHGAYFTTRNVWVMVHDLPPMLGGPYRIPCGHVSLRGVFSNTTPLAAFRGIGRLEANYLTESLVEAAGGRRGSIASSCDGGTSSAPARCRGRRRAARCSRRAPLRRSWSAAGPGRLAAVRRSTGGQPGVRSAAGYRLRDVRRERRQHADGVRGGGGHRGGPGVVRVGTQDFGMGHDTMFSQIAADALGVPFDAVDVVFGDTEHVERGAGSHGSRSARMGGGAVVGSARR